MMSLGEMENMAEKVKIVVNRAGLESGQITLKKAEETIGKPIFWQLPNDYRTMSEVRNNGVPLIEQFPKAAVTQAVVGLAENLCGEPKNGDGENGKKSSSVLGRLFNFGGKGGK
jgi:pilus assembly protein CpaE